MSWQRRLAYELRGRWPWAIWLVVLGVVAWLFAERNGTPRAMGIAETLQISLGPLEPARVVAIEVQPGQRVAAGQVVARLDTSLIEADMAVIEAEIRRLRGELDKELVVATQDQLELTTRLATSAEQASLKLIEARTGEARNRAELAALDAEIGRLEQLVAQQLAPVEPLNELKRERAALAEDRSGNERSIRLLEQHVADSLARLERWRSKSLAFAREHARTGPASSSGDGVEAAEVDAATAYVQPIHSAMEVQERMLERLQREKDAALLRAPIASRVAAVLLQPGSIADSNLPVLTLMAEQTDRVVAWVGEPEATSLRPGQHALLRPRSGSGPPCRAKVLSLGPAVTLAPERFWPIFDRPWYSREAVLRIEEPGPRQGSNLPGVLPGQTFEVTFLDQTDEEAMAPPAPGTGWPARDIPISLAGAAAHAATLGEGGGGAAGGAALPPAATGPGPSAEPLPAPGPWVADGEPRPLSVPAGLKQRSRFEPSGLVWVPELDRYLLVSDDTGQKEQADHAPWVFTATAQGEVDEQPLALQGIAKVNDLEGVARSPDGTIYLLSSQSASKRGRRPPSRELLLRARTGPGRQLTVTGQVRLLAAIAAAAERPGGQVWLEGLGLGARLPSPVGKKPGKKRSDLLLEIEGLAHHEGALLLGLKQPLGPKGEAPIWRLAHPDRLLERGVLEPADLTVLARVALPSAEPGAAAQAMGISGLCTLPGGDLLLLSTIPEGDSQQGAVWRLPAVELSGARAAGPPVRPALLRSIPGHKPEGAAVGPDGLITLVFDAGEHTPLWLRMKT